MLGAGGAWQAASRALRRPALLWPLVLVQTPLMAAALLAAACVLAVYVVSPLLALASMVGSGSPLGRGVLLTSVERQRFTAWLVAAALPWMLLQAAWRAGLLAAADRELRDGRAGLDDWLQGMARGALAMAARRVLAMVVSVVLLLAALLVVLRADGDWAPLAALAVVLTVHLFWSRTQAVQPAAMVAEDSDLLSALPPASLFGAVAGGPLAGLGCLADVARLGCLAPLVLVAVGLLVRGLRVGIGLPGAAGVILVVGALALALAWLDAQRSVAVLALYRGRGGAEGDPALATAGCRAARPAQTRPRPVADGLVVASHPNGEACHPARVAGGAPAARDEPAL